MKEIKPIETVYKGCRFRSRLEARWAVFFDALGVEWEYEPEGFELPSGRRYLPDFRVKCWGRRTYNEHECVNLYIEVKGEMSKYDLERIEEFVGSTDYEEICLTFLCSDCDGDYADCPKGWRCKSEYYLRPVLIVGSIPESIDSFYRGLGMDGFYFSFQYVDGDYYTVIPTATLNGKFYLMGPDYVTNEGVNMLNRALTAARSARFEWGENGESA